MAEEITTSLPSVKQPSVKQENDFSGNIFASNDRTTGSVTCIEQTQTWEIVDECECLEPEVINTRSSGRRKIVISPETSKPTKAWRLKPDHRSHYSLSTGDMKLPKQNMNRSGVLNSTLEAANRNLNQRSVTGALTSAAMPFLSPRSQAFTLPAYFLSSLEDDNNTVQGQSFRKNLSLIYRQNKEMKKLEYDNMASRQALQDAQDLIGDLKAKIEKRNKYIRERNRKEGDLARDVETLRRERDEKLLEYKLIMKKMNEALGVKDKTLEDSELERTQMESVYQDQLKENTGLMRKIETRERQIKQLKEKTEKAMKWKTNVRT